MKITRRLIEVLQGSRPRNKPEASGMRHTIRTAGEWGLIDRDGRVTEAGQHILDMVAALPTHIRGKFK